MIDTRLSPGLYRSVNCIVILLKFVIENVSLRTKREVLVVRLFFSQSRRDRKG